MNTAKSIVATLTVCGLVFALAGCEKPAGPMETAGKEIDSAASKVGEKLEKVGDSIQDAAKGDKK